jgi:hypothetical protein
MTLRILRCRYCLLFGWAIFLGASLTARASSLSGPTDASAADEGQGSLRSPGHWSFAALPRFTLNADDGAGLGVRAAAYWDRFDQRPYKTAVSLQLWATTRLVQQHFVRVDALDVFSWPLRIEAELGLFSTMSQPYCGLTYRRCPDDEEHRMRSTEPYALLQGRFRVAKARWWRDVVKVEVFSGWRGTFYVPGSLFLDDDGDGAPDLFPAPKTLYAREFPRGEPGFASVMQAGVVLDTRDNEPAPRRGFLVDASLRGSAPFFGSTFAFAGVNATGRLFSPLPVTTAPDRPFVVAQRTIVDGVFGDAPVRERMRLGGLVEVPGLGGADTLRGVRLARFPARFRVSHQIELRADVLHVQVGDNDLGVVVAGFVDAGVALFDGVFVTDDILGLLGAGAALRFAWNRNFIFRIDVAASPEEPGRLGFYTAPGHPF